MSTKAKKTAAPKAKTAEKTAKSTAPLKAGKSAKSSKEEPMEDEIAINAAAVASAEEEAEEEEAVASSNSSSGGNAAALAAATSSTEMSASFKNFRHHPDMENFYRFIYENDLRLEALAIIDEMMVERMNRKAIKMAKASAH
ncbi:MAG: hypothetical protein H7301_09710 [Cryobacterium sp.]|nr:hypothetical protein [Oligoflexia bacterium]